MDAVEYLRQRERLCETQQALRRVMNLDANEKELCDGCPLAIYHDHFCGILENSDPDLAVSIVEQWAEAQRSDGVYLSAMDERFVRIYIGKGYLWAARNKNGELWLYIKEPVRDVDSFALESPARNASRPCLMHMLPSITWENSPVCLPRLLERREQ